MAKIDIQKEIDEMKVEENGVMEVEGLLWFCDKSSLTEEQYDEMYHYEKDGQSLIIYQNDLIVACDLEKFKKVSEVEYSLLLKKYIDAKNKKFVDIAISIEGKDSKVQHWFSFFPKELKIDLDNLGDTTLNAVQESYKSIVAEAKVKPSDFIATPASLSNTAGNSISNNSELEEMDSLVTQGQFGANELSKSTRDFIEATGTYTYEKYYDYVRAQFGTEFEKIEQLLAFDDGFLQKLYQAQRDYGLLQIMTGNPAKARENILVNKPVDLLKVEAPKKGEKIDSIVTRVSQMAENHHVFHRVSSLSGFGEMTTYVNLYDDESKFINVGKKNDLTFYGFANNISQDRLKSFLKVKGKGEENQIAESPYWNFDISNRDGAEVDNADIVSQVNVSVSSSSDDMAQISFCNFFITSNLSQEVKKALRTIPIDALTVYLKQGLPPLQVLVNLYQTKGFKIIYDDIVVRMMKAREQNAGLEADFNLWYDQCSLFTRSYQLIDYKGKKMIVQKKVKGMRVYSSSVMEGVIKMTYGIRVNFDETVACDRRSFLSLPTMLSFYPCQALEQRILNDITYHNNDISVKRGMAYVKMGKLVEWDSLYRTKLYDEEDMKVSINQNDRVRYYRGEGGDPAVIDYNSDFILTKVMLSSSMDHMDLITEKTVGEKRSWVRIESALFKDEKDKTKKLKEQFEYAVTIAENSNKCTVIVPISHLIDFWDLFPVIYIAKAPLPCTMAATVHVDKTRPNGHKVHRDVIINFVYLQCLTTKLALDYFLFGRKKMRKLILAKLNVEYDPWTKEIIQYWYDLFKKSVVGEKADDIKSDYSMMLKSSKHLRKRDQYVHQVSNLKRIGGNLARLWTSED